MILLPQILVAASAAIVLLLGLAHLFLTFRGRKLHPRDSALTARMKEVSPILTRETTLWKAWVGFNGSHSLGAILFGLVYGYLALAAGPFLFQSPFLLLLGLFILVSYVLLAKAYWFRIPLAATALATAMYLVALLLAFL